MGDDPAQGLVYDPFGQLVVTGITSYQARGLDPETGSWLSRDSFRGLMSDPRTLNRYAFVTNDPVSQVDIGGLFSLRGLVNKSKAAVSNVAHSTTTWVRQHQGAIATVVSGVVATGLGAVITVAASPFISPNAAQLLAVASFVTHHASGVFSAIRNRLSTAAHAITSRLGRTTTWLSEHISGSHHGPPATRPQAPKPVIAAEEHPSAIRPAGSGPTPALLRVGDVKLPAVPPGAMGTPVRTGKGLEYAIPQGTPEISEQVASVRIMNPTTSGRYQYPNGYAAYMNDLGQTVHPITGQTIPRAHPFAHIPLS